MVESLHPAVVVFKESGLAQEITLVNDLPSRDDIRRILIVKWGGMGDVVISTAIIEDIFRAFPGREIHLNAMPPWNSLFADDPRFSRVWMVDLRNRERNLKGMWRWVRTARAGNYDLIIDLQCNDRTRLLLSALLCSGCRIPWRIGNRPGFPYNISHPKLPGSTHIFQRMRASLLAAGIPVATQRPVLHGSEAQRKRASAILDESGLEDGRFAVFLPGSHAAGLTKRWGVHNYRQLDLFSGSGALGLEALSRGAAHCVFVEQDKATLDALESNISKLGARGLTEIRRSSASRTAGGGWRWPPRGRR